MSLSTQTLSTYIYPGAWVVVTQEVLRATTPNGQFEKLEPKVKEELIRLAANSESNKALAAADINFLERTRIRIFSDAEKASFHEPGIYDIYHRIRDQFILRVGKPKIQELYTREKLYQVNDEIRAIIHSLDLPCPERRVLFPKDVQLCNESHKENCKLENFWVASLFSVYLRRYPMQDRVGHKRPVARSIRMWMNENIELLHSITRLDLNLGRWARPMNFSPLRALPKEISLFVNLESLCLKDNNFINLCPEIEQLEHLHTLILTGNPFPEFPPKIGQLEHRGNGHYSKLP